MAALRIRQPGNALEGMTRAAVSRLAGMKGARVSARILFSASVLRDLTVCMASPAPVARSSSVLVSRRHSEPTSYAALRRRGELFR